MATSKTTISEKLSSAANAAFTAPGLALADGHRVGEILQRRLHALNELHLTLKHVHWNVVGPNFIAVHELLDPQVDRVRDFADAIAERIAALGVVPNGLPGALVAARNGEDYPVQRADTLTHLAALDLVYVEVIEAYRADLDALGELDLLTQDLLIGQARDLEQFQWFLRSHLSNAQGELSHQNSEQALAQEHTSEAAVAAER